MRDRSLPVALRSQSCAERDRRWGPERETSSKLYVATPAKLLTIPFRQGKREDNVRYASAHVPETP